MTSAWIRGQIPSIGIMSDAFASRPCTGKQPSARSKEEQECKIKSASRSVAPLHIYTHPSATSKRGTILKLGVYAYFSMTQTEPNRECRSKKRNKTDGGGVVWAQVYAIGWTELNPVVIVLVTLWQVAVGSVSRKCFAIIGLKVCEKQERWEFMKTAVTSLPCHDF